MNENIAILTVAIMTTISAGFVIDWARSTVLAVRRRADSACAACGYSRRGNRGAICPECGRRV